MEQLISVIVPVYNVGIYLAPCLDSIAAQTHRDLEIILVDDGSTDGSGAVCDRYGAEDPRFVVIHQPNAGVSAARNAGIRIARGAFIAFADSDDLMPEDALAALYGAILRDGSDMATGRHALLYEDGRLDESPYRWLRDGLLTGREVFEKLGTGEDFPLVLWGKLYRREVLSDIVIPKFKCGEDIAVFPAIIEKCARISVVDKLVYHYLQRTTSAVHTYNPQARMDALENDLFLTRYLWDKGFLSGAVRWYNQSINWAYQIRERKQALGMLRKYLNRKTGWALLRRQRVKTWIIWLALYVPVIKTIAERIKGR